MTRLPSGPLGRSVEAFPYESAPRFLLRDRDGVYGKEKEFSRCVRALGIEEVLTAYRSPWQNGYVERLIGTIRRDCLDHVIVWNENHLKRVLTDYFVYYHRWRTHLSLEMDTPERRPVQRFGRIVAVEELGGLHHHYERRAA